MTGWREHPDGFPILTDESGIHLERVPAIGAFCRLLAPATLDDRSWRFSVGEFLVLEDGKIVILHEARGLTVTIQTSDGEGEKDGLPYRSREDLVSDILKVVLPDDEADVELHPWTWLAGLARDRGVNVTEAALRALPYEVAISDVVLRALKLL